MYMKCGMLQHDKKMIDVAFMVVMHITLRYSSLFPGMPLKQG